MLSRMVQTHRKKWLALAASSMLAGCGPAVEHIAQPNSAKAAQTPERKKKPAANDEAAAKIAAVEKPIEPPRLKWVVSPGTIDLSAGDRGVQLRTEAPGARGGSRDATSETRWSVDPPGIVNVSADGYVTPLKSGACEISAEFTRDKQVVPVRVTIPDAPSRAWDFGADIVPILTRQGCNTGGCHGKADGQNGFHLSLFGYDPEEDHRAITRDADGRRLSLFSPIDSLLLRKATGTTPHTGGMRLAPGSDELRTVLSWIEAGAPMQRGKTHGRLKSVAVEPASARLDSPGAIQLRAIATYEDGHRRDVTRLASFRVNDDTSGAVDANGRATLKRRAEVDLIVRFGSQIVATRIATLLNPDLKFDFSKLAKRNVIDTELFKRLEELKVPPSPTASDSAWLRRVTLDLIGRQPEPEEVRQFLADADPDKRPKKVDELLSNRDFLQFWKIKFGDLLQISQARFANGAGRYLEWLDHSLKQNTPWNEMVTELLTALGDPTKRGEGAVNYAIDGPDPKVMGEQTAQRFLGLRFRCSQCHDHPFDVWTQDDYFGLAAFFAKIQRAGPMPGGMMSRNLVSINPKGSIEHPRTKKPATPKIPQGDAPKLDENDDPRKALAEWITKPDNPYFARAMANWVWAQFFGKGIAEPADDLSRANPPVHPELLDALGKHFVEHKYDIRDLIRTVATSEAYGLASSTVPGNEHDTRLFSHQLPRPLTAHQMADTLAQVTTVPNRFGQLGVRKAIEINDPATPSVLLDTFGRCPRTNGCAAVPAPSLSLRQALLLIGGDVVESKVSNLNGYLASLLSQSPPPEPGEIVENLYFRTLCRPPTAEELSHWSNELKTAPALHEAAEDLFWSLLNSREFAFNH